MKRLFIDMDGTLARFHDEAMYIERMYEEGFSKKLNPFTNMVEGIKEFIKMQPRVEVYIISSAIASPYCEIEKNLWLDKYIPEIPFGNRLYPAIGMSKAEYIREKTGVSVGQEDYLLDDYNKGLFDFQRAGGKAIKCHNNVNHKGLGRHGGQKGKLWADSIVHTDDLPIMIASELSSHMNLHFDFKPIFAVYDLSGPDFEYTLLSKKVNNLDVYAWVRKDELEMGERLFRFTNLLDAIRYKGRITPNWRDFYPKEIKSAVKPLYKLNTEDGFCILPLHRHDVYIKNYAIDMGMNKAEEIRFKVGAKPEDFYKYILNCAKEPKLLKSALETLPKLSLDEKLNTINSATKDITKEENKEKGER